MNKRNLIIALIVLFAISYFYNKSKGRDIIDEMKQAAAEGWEEGFNGAEAESDDVSQQAEENGQAEESEQAENQPPQNSQMSDEEYMSMPITARRCLDEYIRRNNVPVKQFSQRAKFDELFQNAIDSLKNYDIPIYTPGMPEQAANARCQTAFTDNDKRGYPVRKDGSKFKIGSPDFWTNCDYIFYGNPKDKKSGDKLRGSGVLFEQFDLGSKGCYLRLVYMGEFKNGKFDGYGQAYYAPEDYTTYDEYIISTYEGRIQEGIYEAMNYMEYEGNFKNGYYDGKGNRYEYLDSESRYILMMVQEPGFDFESRGLDRAEFEAKLDEMLKYTREAAVYVGTFSKGEDKNVKVYVSGEEVDPDNL